MWLVGNGCGFHGMLMYCTPSQEIQYVDILLTEKRAAYRRRSHETRQASMKCNVLSIYGSVMLCPSMAVQCYVDICIRQIRTQE